MAYTETTRTGYFGRIGDAIKGVVFGVILVVVSFILLFWNEGRAVTTARTLEEGKGAVISVEEGKVDPANEGKLIHFTGKAINAGGNKLADSDFGISADAIHLRRNVKMYQWKEEQKTETHKDAVGGGETKTTTYTYSKVWDPSPIKSSEFKEQHHDNPTQWRFSEHTVDASPVTAGAFTLDSALIGQIKTYTPITISSDTVNGLSDALKSDAVYSDNSLYLSNETGTKPNPGSPEIGDLQVTFDAALPGEVSILARQAQATLAPYQTKNKSIELLYAGNRSANDMFTEEEKKNTQLTWILRGVGFVVMWIGFALFLNPLKVLSDVIGIIGDIVGAGIFVVTGVMAVALSFITIAIAWITYRPVVGIGLLVVALGAIVAFFVLRSKGAANRKIAGAGQPVA